MMTTLDSRSDMTTRYVQAAVDAEIESLREVRSGRACAAFRAAAAIGGFVGAGEIGRAEVEALLLDAAIQTGLPASEAIGHVRRGLARGEMTPRSVSDPRTASRSRQSTHPRFVAGATVREELIQRPPKSEVDGLWAGSRPVSADPDVARWLCNRYCVREEHPAAADCQRGGERGFCYQDCCRFRYRPSDGQPPDSPSTSADPERFCYRYHSLRLIEHIEIWDLCRAIPSSTKLPSWAWSRAGSWNQTAHRAIFRLWDHHGRVVSLRARCIDPAITPKSLAPSRFSVKGLVLADPLGVQLLSGSVPPWWDQHQIIISEGEIDWMIWAGRQRETEPQGPACFGIEAGAWSKAIADRIPDDSSVVLRTHHDGAGERYASQIASTLSGRCSLFRSLPEEEAG